MLSHVNGGKLDWFVSHSSAYSIAVVTTRQPKATQSMRHVAMATGQSSRNINKINPTMHRHSTGRGGRKN